MAADVTLKALYYPYARCSNEKTLKRSVLIFDELGFVDPTSPEMREGLITDEREIPQSVIEDWETIRDVYGVLIERGIVRIYDPDPLINNYDHLLGNSLKADLDDDEIWKLCTAQGTPETWIVLRRKVPSSAFEFLNSQTLGRINYGTARAKAYFHHIFLDWPNLKDEKWDKSGLGPFDIPRMGKYDMGEWHRYLFHDGKIAREMNSYYIKDKKKREDYITASEFYCIFPFTHWSCLSTNTCILLSNVNNLILFTDSRLHNEMLAVKFKRAVGNVEKNEPLISGMRSDSSVKKIFRKFKRPVAVHREKLRRLNAIYLSMYSTILDDKCIDNMSITDCIKYRDASKEAFRQLKIYIYGLISQIESEPWSDEFEKEVQKFIYQKIIPEAQKAKEKGIEIYKKLFGTIAKKAVASLTPTLGVSVFAGLTLPMMLALGSAAALGEVLPDLTDTSINEERTGQRNALSCLLDLNK